MRRGERNKLMERWREGLKDWREKGRERRSEAESKKGRDCVREGERDERRKGEIV